MNSSVLIPALAGLLLGLTYFWRNYGTELTFSTPTSVTVTAGASPAPRTITFSRLWPYFGWHVDRKIPASLEVGTIISVDLASPQIPKSGWGYADTQFRVEMESYKVGDTDIIYTLFLKTDKVIKGAKQVTLRIKHNDDPSSDATNQKYQGKKENFFWVREFYDCEVIAVS